MQNYKLWWLLLGLAYLSVIAGCEHRPPLGESQQDFYDVKGFLDQQIQALNTLKMRVKKQSGESRISSPRAIKDWAQELSLFTSAHINRPIFDGAYTVKETLKPVRKLVYTAKDPKLTTREIEIIFSAAQLPDTIRFLYQKKSWFYDSERKMEMIFARSPSQKARLASYKVVGFQKSILGNCQNYSLLGLLTK
ncbi:MAG: hypothetical protein OHK0053_00350 [Microscillaceae bacterium]